MPFVFDIQYLLFVGPAILLGLWAQARVKSAFAEAQKIPTSVSGAQAARRVLDEAGLHDVAIEEVAGFLSDHYDPRHKVLRLSPAVYRERSMAAVGVAAHEAGHAIQDARHYAPLVIRNAAVPAASFGGGISWTLIFVGMLMNMYQPLIILGILCFSAVVFFQVVNLPVEFNASSRAKEQLAALGITAYPQQQHVEKVLNAAAWTYVAGTLQSVMILIYMLMRFGGGRD
jgi:Zn-dependent membrane protease YugP